MFALRRKHLDETAPGRAGRIQPVRTFASGTALFREADPAPYMFEIVTGTARLVRILASGRRQVVAFAHPGDVVGFPDGGRHHSDCEALTDVTVLAHRANLLTDANADPEIHRLLQSAALREIHGLQDHLLLMARKGAQGKLASFIALLADSCGIPRDGATVVDLAMPRADIADFLCMSVETVSRMLTSMRLSGVIRLDGPQRVVVLDRLGLAAICDCE